MKTIKEHVNVLLKYWRSYYTDGGFPTLFSLKVEMLEHGICPRCGWKSWCSSTKEKMDCFECGLKITNKEWCMIEDGKKGILRRKLKMKPAKNFESLSKER